MHNLVLDDGVPHTHVDQLGPEAVGLGVKPHLDLVNDAVPAPLAGDGLDLLAFVGPDVVAAEGLPDVLQAPRHDLRIGRGAILAQQVLQHVDGHVEAGLRLVYQVFADDTTGKSTGQLLIQLIQH